MKDVKINRPPLIFRQFSYNEMLIFFLPADVQKKPAASVFTKHTLLRN
jgi:hypothetical protein